jgi:hypothetical protein
MKQKKSAEDALVLRQKDEKQIKIDKELLRKKLADLRAHTRWLGQFEDKNPVLVPSKKAEGKTGVFFLQPDVVEYSILARKNFGDRNKTFKENFRWYALIFLSELIEKGLSDDQESFDESVSARETYSINLKRINRNYAAFNDALLKDFIVEFLEQYNADDGRCIKYGASPEVLKKGIRRGYLSKNELKRLKQSIRLDTRPDKTEKSSPEVVRYFCSILNRTRMRLRDVEKIEVEAGRFRKMYPLAVRFIARKFDGRIGEKDGRFHANYTYAPSEFRGLMRYDGKQQFVEGDVAACHFHFLLDEMTDDDERRQMVKDLAAADPYLTMCGNPVGVERTDLKQSSHLFKFANRDYRRRPRLKRDGSKSALYREGLFYLHLKSKYPVFAEAMAQRRISQKSHRSSFACRVMKREAKVMVHAVGRRCKEEGLVYLPVHDGFLTLPEQFDRVCEIVVEAFRAETGSVPRIKRK